MKVQREFRISQTRERGPVFLSVGKIPVAPSAFTAMFPQKKFDTIEAAKADADTLAAQLGATINWGPFDASVSRMSGTMEAEKN